MHLLNYHKQLAVHMNENVVEDMCGPQSHGRHKIRILLSEACAYLTD